MRLAVRLEAVIGAGGDTAGVADTGVPDFVCRRTEREVRKTVESFDPARPARLAFLYGLRLPLARLDAHHPPRKGAALRLAAGMARALGRLFPRQGHRYAFHVDRTAPPAPVDPRGVGRAAPRPPRSCGSVARRDPAPFPSPCASETVRFASHPGTRPEPSREDRP
ncbi:MAG: hypothetical protein R6V44_06605 [Paracoccaceae bacterium]